jgi:hypothetical protein
MHVNKKEATITPPHSPPSLGQRLIHITTEAAILLSFGFDQICPELRQKHLKYVYIPAHFFLALNKFASNLSRDMYEFVT